MGERRVHWARLGSVIAVVALLSAFVPTTVTPVRATGRSDIAWDLRPPIVWKRIPFPDLRKDQTAAYSQRHSGRWAWRLDDPAVIVEHFTNGTSFVNAWNAFAANAKALGEKPGPCAHFLIDTDGTIYQLTDLEVRCRHTVGLNHVAIGIEHVGTSARRVLGNAAMMRSSLRLTLWHVASEGIQVRNVIGHAESLESPYHLERNRDWACKTSGDFNHRSMRLYRGLLRGLARANDVAVGPSPDWVDPPC
jgi:N-acetylmuramoyl-L-alanine amidase